MLLVLKNIIEFPKNLIKMLLIQVCSLSDVPLVNAVLFAKVRLLDGGTYEDTTERVDVRNFCCGCEHFSFCCEHFSGNLCIFSLNKMMLKLQRFYWTLLYLNLYDIFLLKFEIVLIIVDSLGEEAQCIVDEALMFLRSNRLRSLDRSAGKVPLSDFCSKGLFVISFIFKKCFLRFLIFTFWILFLLFFTYRSRKAANRTWNSATSILTSPSSLDRVLKVVIL